MNAYQIGETVILEVIFKRRDGTVYEPDSVTVRVLNDEDEEIIPAPMAVSLGDGLYEATVVPDSSGRWDYRFEADGDITTAQQGTFYVRHTAFSV